MFRGEINAKAIYTHIIHENSSKASYLFPIPYSSTGKELSQLFHTIHKSRENNFKDIEIVVVGHILSEIEAFATKGERSNNTVILLE